MEALSDHYTWQSWWIRYDHRRRITRFRKRRSLFCCWDKRKLLLLCASDTEWSGSVPCPKVKWVRPRRLYPGPRGFLLFFICNFCDANRFLYFFYWHEALRAEKRKPLVATVENLTFMLAQHLTAVKDVIFSWPITKGDRIYNLLTGPGGTILRYSEINYFVGRGEKRLPCSQAVKLPGFLFIPKRDKLLLWHLK